MKTKFKPSLYWLVYLVLLLHSAYADETPKANETSTAAPTTTTTLKPKINIVDSDVCKKCSCNVTYSLLDCTGKLKEWFTNEDWALLQSGDIIFDTIKLENNSLTSVPILPKYDVKNLYLAHNEIEAIAIGAFQNLTQLTKLDLAHNKITSKILVPDVFQGPYSPKDYEPLGNLKSINLGYNELHSLNDDLFEHVPNLEELVLCGNTFIVIDKLTETALSGLTSLKTLDISYLEIKSLPETLLHGPRGLETLIAAGNLFEEIPAGLQYSTNLQLLVLDENPIRNLVEKNVFPNLINLKYLSMAYMPDLHKIGAGAFSNLQNLTQLILGDNEYLNEIDVNAFSKNITGGEYLDYPPLENLYLNNCNLTGLPRSLIVRWDKVKILDLRFNPWNCDTSIEWMISNLMRQIKKNTPILAESVECATPLALKSMSLLKVSTDNLDTRGQGTSFWIWALVSIVLAIPIALIAFVIHRRGCFGLVNARGNRNSRRGLYDRTTFDEDVHI